MATRQRRQGRAWHTAAAGVLLAVAVFAAVVQGGVLAPKFEPSGSGTALSASNGSTYLVLQNVSWRSWTISGVGFATDQSPKVLASVRTGALSVHRGRSGTGPAIAGLTVEPGQTFSVDLVQRHRVCPEPGANLTTAQFERFAQTVNNNRKNVLALISVVTPFGTRTVGATFTTTC